MHRRAETCAYGSIGCGSFFDGGRVLPVGAEVEARLFGRLHELLHRALAPGTSIFYAMLDG